MTGKCAGSWGVSVREHVYLYVETFEKLTKYRIGAALLLGSTRFRIFEFLLRLRSRTVVMGLSVDLRRQEIRQT